MNQEERHEKIEEYGRGFDSLNTALEEAPREAWDFKPAPREWSIHEIIIHMKDSDSMGVVRLHKLIAEPGSTLIEYEEDRWSNALNYQNQDVDDALQIFKLTRRTAYCLLITQPDEVFMQSVLYPGYDQPYTLEKWLNTYTRHVREHVEQVRKTYQAWKEQKK